VWQISPPIRLSGLTAKPPRDARTLSFPHLPFAPRALLPQRPTRLALFICLFFSVLSFVMRCALFLGLYGFPQGVFETLPSFPLRPLCFAPLFSTDPSPFRLPLSRPRVFAFGSRPLSHPSPSAPLYRRLISPLYPAPSPSPHSIQPPEPPHMFLRSSFLKSDPLCVQLESPNPPQLMPRIIQCPPTPPAPLHLIPLTMGRML